MMNLAFLDIAEYLPAVGSSEFTHCSALLAHVAFALVSNLSFSQPMSSHTSITSFLSPIPPARFTKTEKKLDEG